MGLTKKQANDFRTKLGKLLQEHAAELGVASIEAKRSTFCDDGGYMTIKVEVTFPGGQSPDAMAYELARGRHNLPPLGTILEWGAERRFEIIGANTRGKAICREQGTDKLYLVPFLTVALKAGKALHS